MTKPGRVLAAAVLLAAARWGAPPRAGALHPVPPVPRLPARRSACAKLVPVDISVKALATPVVGKELDLEISAQNRGLNGPFECRLRVPDGALEPLDGPLLWVRALAPNQPETWTTRVKVVSAAPIAITAKARPVVCPPTMGNAEGYLTLYPFEVNGGALRPTWNETTLQPLSGPPQPTVTLPGGEKAVMCNGTGSVSSVK